MAPDLPSYPGGEEPTYESFRFCFDHPLDRDPIVR
jgi:hypothetical protein